MDKNKILKQVHDLLKAMKRKSKAQKTVAKDLSNIDLAKESAKDTSAPDKTMGVHRPFAGKGTSIAGHAVRGHWSYGDKLRNLAQARRQHKQVQAEAANIKPNLPKSEITKEETKHDRCVEEVSQDPSIKNPHAVCVAAGVKPEKWKKSEEFNMDKKQALETAKALLKAAQEDPKKFEEELKKASAAPMPAPATSTTAPASMPKPKAPKMPPPPKPSVQAPGLGKEQLSPTPPVKKCGQMMTKEEIKADLKKEWQPKFKKADSCAKADECKPEAKEEKK